MEINDPRLQNAYMTDDKTMVKVKCMDPALLYRGNEFYLGVRDALNGEAAGKWKIVRRTDSQATYQTKVMLPEALTTKDVYGNKSEKPEVPKEEYQTRNLKKKSIAWLMDNFIVGGAELSCQTVIKIGIDCGFRIGVLSNQTDPVHLKESMLSSDIIVLNNLFGFSEASLRVIQEVVYSGKPYVKYEHDHRELARPDFSLRLFRQSKKNFFISPLQLDNHRRAFGCDGVALPLAIDLDLYRPVKGETRAPNSALLCNLRNFKKWDFLQAFINEHQEMTFTILGDAVISGANVHRADTVMAKDMPKVYSRHEYLVHILDGYGAGERVIFEAALCGCKIIANDHVGHMSWKKDLSDIEGLRTWLRPAPYQFWREIERVMD